MDVTETGCTECGSTDFSGIEYWYTSENHYDGVSEWRCNRCGTRYGRWSGKILAEGEEEPRYGAARKR